VGGGVRRALGLAAHADELRQPLGWPGLVVVGGLGVPLRHVHHARVDQAEPGEQGRPGTQGELRDGTGVGGGGLVRTGWCLLVLRRRRVVGAGLRYCGGAGRSPATVTATRRWAASWLGRVLAAVRACRQ
jgi:hypothetical protein